MYAGEGELGVMEYNRKNRADYETEFHLQNETDVIERICNHIGADYKKIPFTYRMDFAVHKLVTKKIWFFLEVKVRTFEMNRYKTSFVNLDKATAARDLTRNTGIPCYLAVQWKDRLGTIDFNEQFTVEYGGRFDRGDSQDDGIVAHFDVDKFTILDV